MRRNHRENKGKQDKKNMLYASGAFVIIALITFITAFAVYTNQLKGTSNRFSTEKIASLVPNETETQEANSKMGRTIEESENLLESNTIGNTTSSEEKNTSKENTTNQVIGPKTTKETNASSTANKQEEKQEEVADPEFVKPVEGEVTKKFTNENLAYSETLKEWTTHYGVDILAAKTSMVKAAAGGTVTAIKNDPRYGMTVIIEHANGFETRYSNLLTSEFVVVGEKVEQGQSIGTVGNSAMFEVADESHLHFELLKNSEALDPELYLK